MNIQTKQRYILPALLLLRVAYQQEEWARPEADSSDIIRFAAPIITAEGLTRSALYDIFPTGGTFGVLGYCVPYQYGNDIEMDWASGSANWDSKSGDVFPGVLFNQVVTYNGSACAYGYNNSGDPRKWYNTTQNQGAVPPNNYRYIFLAYYPMDDSIVKSPTNATIWNVPKLTLTISFAETDGIATTTLDDKETPDAMASVVYDHLRTTENVHLNFSHVMTGLGLAVGSCNYEGDDETATAKRTTLSGNFTRSITMDFSKNTDKDGFYTYSDTYPGIYIVYNDEGGLAIIPNSSIPLMDDKHLLLLSDVTDDTHFGKNVEVHAEYTYRGEVKNVSAERPVQLQPRVDVHYTAQLNFVDEALALNFTTAEDEFWEGGSDSDVSIQ